MTITQAQEQLPNLPSTLQSEPAIITQDGVPVLIAFTIKNFLSFLETAEILADENFITSLNIGIQQADDGEYFDLADIEAELGL
ncbi:MAG: prevent-host-death protein [Cyanobacteria bacterium P01_D01_bin.1]